MNVYYNFGRWVVHCPSNDCLAAERVEPNIESVECRCKPGSLCQHGNPCGTEILLEWPENVEEIEQVTAARPIRNRHWLPGETIEDLKRENLLHGVRL